MEQQARAVLTTIRDSAVLSSERLSILESLKAYIKHHAVSAAAVQTTFEIIRLGISTFQLDDFAFSMLSH
jgi:hypothetical protein